MPEVQNDPEKNDVCSEHIVYVYFCYYNFSERTLIIYVYRMRIYSIRNLQMTL